jgi:hypothetical protein
MVSSPGKSERHYLSGSTYHRLSSTDHAEWEVGWAPGHFGEASVA